MDAGDDCSSEALPGTLSIWICFQAMTKMILENQQELDAESGYYMLIKLMHCGIKKKKATMGKMKKCDSTGQGGRWPSTHKSEIEQTER